MTKGEAAEFVLPKTLAGCADLLYTTRQARLEMDKQVEAMKARETELRQHLIDNLPVSEATGVAGKVARATIVTKDEPDVQDWDATWEYIRKTKSYDLIQKRISPAAVKERWENNKVVPGIGHRTVKSVSLNKVK